MATIPIPKKYLPAAYKGINIVCNDSHECSCAEEWYNELGYECTKYTCNKCGKEWKIVTSFNNAKQIEKEQRNSVTTLSVYNGKEL